MLARLAMLTNAGKRRFRDLSEQEVLALAISSEEEDGGIYAAYAAKLRDQYPASAAVFDGMAVEESEHRRRLIEAYQRRFGEFVIPIRREHVSDFYTRRPVWLVENLGLDRVRQEAMDMERQARDFYIAAAGRSTDAATRKLLGDLAAAEAGHQAKADDLSERHLGAEERQAEDRASRRQFVLTWVQPGLAGLMDGSVRSSRRCPLHPPNRARPSSVPLQSRMRAGASLKRPTTGKASQDRKGGLASVTPSTMNPARPRSARQP